ncbi:MAG: hypothetical protein H7232_16750, partial [Aeromicrobium sp.]|nr:hypothetical protein [Burkholderiales bacterium]
MFQSRFKRNLALTVSAAIVLAACAPLNRVPDAATAANATKATPVPANAA